MPTRHDLLIRSAARLYSLGVDVEGAREKLRELVNKKVSYESPEMRETLRNFQELNVQFKSLEQDYLALRGEITGLQSAAN